MCCKVAKCAIWQAQILLGVSGQEISLANKKTSFIHKLGKLNQFEHTK